MADEKSEDKKKAKEKRPTAIKRDIQNEKRRLINQSFKSQVRTALRSVDEALQGKNKESLQSSINAVYSLMDKGVKRKLFKQNTADRTKARISSKASALSA